MRLLLSITHCRALTPASKCSPIGPSPSWRRSVDLRHQHGRAKNRQRQAISIRPSDGRGPKRRGSRASWRIEVGFEGGFDRERARRRCVRPRDRSGCSKGGAKAATNVSTTIEASRRRIGYSAAIMRDAMLRLASYDEG